MINGIGIDIVEKKRISNILQIYGDRFARKILCDDEFKEFSKKKNDIDWIAGRFSAKEAASKALGTGMSQGIWFKDFCVESSRGKPVMKLKKRAKKKAGKGKIHISISHERLHAVALAVFEKG